MDNAGIARTLSAAFGLTTPPVAMSFVESQPPGIPVFTGQVPSACTLWRRAETDTFYAPAESHYNCPIGALTMGFELPASVQQQLGGFLEKMCTCGYVQAEEAPMIPSVSKSKQGIAYGPLERFPLAPDLILMWLTPRQAMIYGEAVGSCRWTEAATPVFGRPACAVLPVAFEKSQPATSFGCMGMRTFTEISDDRRLAAIPGGAAEEFVQSLNAVMVANETMREFYEGHKASFTA